MKRVIDFQMFSILLWNERTQQMEHRFSSRYGERVVRQHNVRLGEGLIGTAAERREPVLAPDVRKEPRYVAENPETRSELAVPLIYKGNVIGVLDLEHTRVNYFNEDHQRTLTTLAAQIAISIANARLYQRIHEEEQRMERDLDMAREVQLRLLPPTPPQPQRAEIAARFLAARSIGGDVYDFLDYGPGRTGLAVGDVSGKAAPAALYAALVSGILRSLAAQHLSPAKLLAALNDQLQERKLDSQYVTMLMAIWDDDNQTLQIANAGSVQPVFVSSTPNGLRVKTVKTIQAEGFPLGLFPDAEYEEFTLATRPGDMIVFFSDGIVDAENASWRDVRHRASGRRPAGPDHCDSAHRRVGGRCHPRSGQRLPIRNRALRRRNRRRAARSLEHFRAFSGPLRNIAQVIYSEGLIAKGGPPNIRPALRLGTSLRGRIKQAEPKGPARLVVPDPGPLFFLSSQKQPNPHKPHHINMPRGSLQFAIINLEIEKAPATAGAFLFPK